MSREEGGYMKMARAPPEKFENQEIKFNSEVVMDKVEKIKVLVFNTFTNELEDVYVNPEVAQTYKRTGWNIKDNDRSFFKHEIQMSSLIGGQDNAYENFREFVNDSDNMQENIERKILVDKLHKALKELDETDCRIICLIFYEGLSERECAEKIGVLQPVLHRKKHKILNKLKKILK